MKEKKYKRHDVMANHNNAGVSSAGSKEYLKGNNKIKFPTDKEYNFVVPWQLL